MQKLNRWSLLFAMVVAPVFSGCGGREGIVPVSGTVNIDGVPVAKGQVTVYPEGHRPATGRIEGGKFTLSCFERNDGAPVGTHVATVTAVEQLSETSNKWYAPKKYANKLDSGLTVTIEDATDDLQIDLTWQGSKQSEPFVDSF